MKKSLKFIIGSVTLIFVIVAFSVKNDIKLNPLESPSASRIEMFTFSSNNKTTKGKIYLPAAHRNNKNLPAIYLIDFTEQHFKVATDEFEKVIEGVQQVQGLDALVISLESIPDNDSKPESFQEYYDIYKNMASYVDDTYTKNTSRTFIGRGSEASIVLMALFIEDPETTMFDNFIVTDPSPSFTTTMVNMLEKGDFPTNKRNKKLHFSFSKTNNRAKCTQLINLIDEAQYRWLEFESVEYENIDYENTYPVSFAAGIEFVFKE